MKKYTKVKKIFCDFCDNEIDQIVHNGGPLIQERVDLKGKQIGIEIRVRSGEKHRFANDICRACIFEAVDLLKEFSEFVPRAEDTKAPARPLSL